MTNSPHTFQKILTYRNPYDAQAMADYYRLFGFHAHHQEASHIVTITARPPQEISAGPRERYLRLKYKILRGRPNEPT